MRKQSCLFSFVSLTLFLSTGSVQADALSSEGFKAPIGIPMEHFLSQYEDAVKNEFRAKLQTEMDPVRRDAIRKELDAKSRTLGQTFTSFEGNSVYDRSLLTGEFVHGQGDTMMHERAGEEATYYFFSEARLWKVLRALPGNTNIQALTAKYELMYGKGSHEKDENGHVTVFWTNGSKVIVLRDRTSEYGCFTLTEAEASLYDARKIVLAAQPSHPELDPMVQAVLGGGNDDSIGDVVDSILDQPATGTF